MSETRLRDWRDHFAQSHPGKTRVAAEWMYSAQRFIPPGFQIRQRFLPEIWLKARSRLRVSGVDALLPVLIREP